jgi:hypothetical protein
MTRDVQALENGRALVLRRRSDDLSSTGTSVRQKAELKIVRHPGGVQVQISIEKRHARRTVHMSDLLCCGPDIAKMIADACSSVS